MPRLPLSVLLLLATACAELPVQDSPSQNQDSRIQHLVIHFTSEDFGESLRLLTQRTGAPVSAHYLIPEGGDPSHAATKPVIHRLVPEGRRAWHAGRSRWGARTALNDSAIGIELVNRSACVAADAEPDPDTENCTFQPYDPEQIALLVRLAQDILARNPDIAPQDVLGHADVAPQRRVDPGPHFPWHALHEAGVGAWYDRDRRRAWQARHAQTAPDLAALQTALAAYGYDIEATGAEDVQSRFAVRAFQMHFRPERYDGRFDAETAAILFALLERYRPRALSELGWTPPGTGRARDAER
jgi:N-acetyl-anhydromuramyl-L-alanine amidase AmpD